LKTTRENAPIRSSLTRVGKHRRRFDILTAQLAIAKRHLDCFSALWDAQAKIEQELHHARDFWFLTAGAHMRSTLLQLCGVYDYDTDGINLLRYLSEVQKDWSREVVKAGLNSQLRCDIAICGPRPSCVSPDRQSYVALVRTLREWRNNIVAHLNYNVALYDAEGFRMRNPWTVSGIRQLIDEAVATLDRYAFDRGKDVLYTECFDGDTDYLLATAVISDSARAATVALAHSKP
jgi:AbiU2